MATVQTASCQDLDTLDWAQEALANPAIDGAEGNAFVNENSGGVDDNVISEKSSSDAETEVDESDDDAPTETEDEAPTEDDESIMEDGSAEEETADNIQPPPGTAGEATQASAESMKLNDAFVALEDMRKASLELEFGGKAIPDVCLFHEYCTTCLHSLKRKEEKKLQRFTASKHNTADLAKKRKFLKHVVARIRTQRKSPPCLICSSPVCKKHACKEFLKEKINVCEQCAPLFTMDFVVSTISDDTEEVKRQKCIAHMIDSYDRSLLMLRYSAQYIDEIAEALEKGSKRNDHIGLGSSSVGLMSGFTGVAAVAAQFVAAAAILSPAGPPLIVASIFFGASAAATAGGADAMSYYSEPNQLANKIIALHDCVKSLVGVTSVLKDAMVRGHIDPRHFTDMGNGKKRSTYWKSRTPKPVKPPAPAVKLEEVTETTVDMQDSLTSTSEEKQAEAISPASKAAVAVEISEAEGGVTEAVEEKPVASLADPDFDDDDDDEVQEELNKSASAAVEESNPVETDQAAENVEAAAPKIQDSTQDEGQATAAKQGDSEKLETDTVVTEASAGNDDDRSQTESTTSAKSDGKPKAKEVVATKKSTTTTAVVKAPSNTRCAISRATTNAMKIAQFASIACVMLSAATIIMETKNLHDTLENIRKGSPCEKAAALRKIKEEIDDLPDTKVVAQGCESYMRVFRSKQTPKSTEQEGKKAESAETAQLTEEKQKAAEQSSKPAQVELV